MEESATKRSRGDISLPKCLLLVILGPTAVGKTEVALNLLSKIRGEIISADSRQIYKGMDIGTGKPSLMIRKKFSHHLVDIISPSQIFNAGEFKKQAEEIIKKLQKEDKLPLVVGGTALYIKALVDGLFVGPGADWNLREKLKQEAEKKGNKALYEKLKKIDPETASRVHPNDQRRVIRALEVYYLSGKKISSYQKERPSSLLKTVIIGLRRKRDSLYKLINERVDKMIKEGLIQEVETLLKKGYSEELPSMQGLGYRQIIGYLKGKYSKEEAIRLIKRDTRRFSKRQLSWFKKDKRIIWLNMEDYSFNKAADKIIEILKERINGSRKTSVFN